MRAKIMLLPGRRHRPGGGGGGPAGPRGRRARRTATRSSSTSSRSAAARSIAHGTALTDEALAACQRVRRGAARRGRRAEVGRSREQGAARAGPAGAAQGARRLRQPAPGQGPSGARRRVAAQAREARGRRHPGRPRADRRPVFRPRRRARSCPAATSRSTDTLEYHDYEIRRVVELAFRLARGRRRKVTSVDKANVLESSRLWRQIATEVGAANPDIALDHMLVDTAAMQLIANPARFDVVVTENMFGDILTDEAAVLAGSMGMLPSASLGEARPRPVRADPRLGAGHRRQGHRQPDRHDPVGGAAAAVFAQAGTRSGGDRVGRGSSDHGRLPDARSRRDADDDGDDGRDHQAPRLGSLPHHPIL